MKKSISYLPSANQRDLHYIVESILTRIKQTEMIILFGSYARNAIRLVFTLENPKQHNLSKLLNSVKKYSHEFIKVFLQDTPEEKRLF